MACHTHITKAPTIEYFISYRGAHNYHDLELDLLTIFWKNSRRNVNWPQESLRYRGKTKVLWQNLIGIMKNALQRKTQEGLVIQWEGRFALVISLFIILFIPLVMGVSLDSDFFGADWNKLTHKPKHLKICHKSDKKLDKCIKSSLEKFIEAVKSDSERLNLPDLNPIEIPLLEFQLGSGNVSLHITFKDFRIKGFKDFKVTNVKSNLIDSKFEISVENPLVIMTGQFSAEGGVFTFPISGQGDFYLNLTDVSSVLIFRFGTLNVKPGLSYYNAEKCIVDLLSSEIDARFGEFIDGSNAIGEAFNTFFNNNAHEIFTLVKPKISETLANVFCSIANEILYRYPANVLFPD